MKCDSVAEYAPLAEACCQFIEEHGLKERVIVECFKLPALAILKQIDAEIKTAALFEPVLSTPSVLSDQRIIDQATPVGRRTSLYTIAWRARVSCRESKHAGLHVAVWTVDDPTWIERARDGH